MAAGIGWYWLVCAMVKLITSIIKRYKCHKVITIGLYDENSHLQSLNMAEYHC